MRPLFFVRDKHAVPIGGRALTLKMDDAAPVKFVDWHQVTRPGERRIVEQTLRLRPILPAIGLDGAEWRVTNSPARYPGRQCKGSERPETCP